MNFKALPESVKALNPHVFAKTIKAPAKPEAKGLQFIKAELDKAGIGYMTEHRFAEPRRFRFDVCIPALKVAIEYEGIYCKKSRHTTQSGFNRDIDKYNMANTLGWTVYRYTDKNYKQFESDLLKIIEK